MINSKNANFFLIPYLTVSCSLYQLVYWGLFGLNGLSLISTEDILKSTIQPILISFVFTTFGYFFTNKILHFKTKSLEYSITQNKENKLLTAIISMFIYGIMYFIVTLIYTDSNGVFLSFFLSLVLASFIDIDLIFSSSYQTKFDKNYLLLLLIYFPLNSIGTAFDDSYLILMNKEYKYSIGKISERKDVLNNTDTLKFLGKNDEYFIFTDLSNSKTFFIKSDTVTLINR